MICKRCLWYGLCSTCDECPDFFPVDDSELYDRMVDAAYDEFIADWLDYIDDDND